MEEVLMSDLKASWEYEQPWIPNRSRLSEFVHTLSQKFGFHDWFHNNKWCKKFAERTIMECDLFRIFNDEIRKEIDENIIKSILGINNLAPKTTDEVLTVEKLKELEEKYNAERLRNIHGSSWTDCFNNGGIFRRERTASIPDERTDQGRV
jgi:hypothetical protein